MGGMGGKGGGSSYSPPTVPPVPVYQPPAALPPLPEDPAAKFNADIQAKQMAALREDAKTAERKAKLGENSPTIYTREEGKSVKQARGPLSAGS